MPEVDGEPTAAVLAERIRGLEGRLTDRATVAQQRYDELRESILKIEKTVAEHHHSNGNSNGRRGWRGSAQMALPMTGGGAGLAVLGYELVRLLSQ